MIETRAYLISRLFDNKNSEVMFGTRLETDGDFVKIYDGNTLVYLHKGYTGTIKDIGSKESYLDIQRMQLEVLSTIAKAQAMARAR